jgi:splicing factor 3B subunit 4
VDERLLYDTFSRFGIIATTAKVSNSGDLGHHFIPCLTLFQIARDPATGQSKGYGFVSYTDFEAADAAIEQMNNQFLMNKAITVQYAFKKDGKGERHGTPAERLLAAQARKNNALPVAARPPPAPLGAFGAAPGVPPPPMGFAAGYQGQFAGVLAAPVAPPPGFTPQQTMMGMPPPPSGFTGGPASGLSGMFAGPPPSMGMMPPPGAPPPGFQGAMMMPNAAPPPFLTGPNAT